MSDAEIKIHDETTQTDDPTAWGRSSCAAVKQRGACQSCLTPGPTAAASFVDLGAQGFGAAPRLLTLQTNDFESGSVTPVDVVHGDAVTGANKSTTPTLSTLGWTSGAKELCAKVGDGLTG